MRRVVPTSDEWEARVTAGMAAQQQGAMNQAGYASCRWRTPDGPAIAYRDYPALGAPRGLPVLCLHGLTRNARDFEELAPQIAARGRRVLAPEARGRGGSDWDAEPARYQPQTYAADTLGLLAALAIGRVIVVGTSMGGLMAMLMAAERPGLIAASVLNDIGPEIMEAGLDRIKGYVGAGPPAASWAEAAARTRAINGPAFPRESGEAFWDAFARRLFAEDEQGVIRLDYDPAIAERVRAGQAAPPDMWPNYEALARAPVLLIRGGLSDILAADAVSEMAVRAKDFAAVEIADVGHAPLLTEPAAWAAIAAFLDRVP